MTRVSPGDELKKVSEKARGVPEWVVFVAKRQPAGDKSGSGILNDVRCQASLRIRARFHQLPQFDPGQIGRTALAGQVQGAVADVGDPRP